MVSRADDGLKTKTYTSFEISTHHRPHTRTTLLPMVVSASATLIDENEQRTMTTSKSHHGDTKATVITNQNMSPTGSLNDFFL
uniref:Uncharacterized protein n=1 Tax=Panagrellus redivivus TaxID=6233 RepID=A0A7E4ZUZ0_PANRE